MDIMLGRILSLIPKKENGDFKHGAQSAFARPLGFKDGHIISDWIAGNSTSYKNYLYQISAQHNVSVEWLKGETSDPGIKKEPTGQSADGQELEFIELMRKLTDTEKDVILAQLRGLAQGR